LNRVLVPDLMVPPRVPSGAPFQVSGVTMGTSWSVRGFATAASVAQIEDAIARTLDGIVNVMSQWVPDSVISRFNAAPPGVSVPVPRAFCEVLTASLAVAAETDGAFDPSIGAVVDLWGFGPQPRTDTMPSGDDIATALDAAGWQKLDYDATLHRLVQTGGVRLDFSGIAKGYAVDQLAHLLHETGLSSYLVEIGGELRGTGIKPDCQPWWVEIERPAGSETAPIRVALSDLAIATSGDYRRGIRLDDGYFSHTIDPRTGRPSESAVAAATVLHPECMFADAYATALMVLGPEAGLAFAERHGLLAMLVVRGASGMQEVFTSALAGRLG
jgi:FAD:protein FMN transferase